MSHSLAAILQPIVPVAARQLERFWSKVDVTDRCFVWTGAATPRRYGQIRIHGRLFYAHRVAFEWYVGALPTGRVVDHLCRQHDCVRPTHLDAVPQGVNVRRGDGPSAWNVIKTKCIRGHPLPARQAGMGWRRCRACDTPSARVPHAARVIGPPAQPKEEEVTEWMRSAPPVQRLLDRVLALSDK